MVTEGNQQATAERLSPAQRQAAKFLARSQAESASVTVFGEIDMTALQRYRAGLGEAPRPPKVTHFLLRALAEALLEHRRLNAHLDDDSLKLFDEVNIGLAVALENGDLMTPVLRRLEASTLAEIAAEADALVARTRRGELALADVKGAGFTLSNVGASPTARWATPIVPMPQVAILAVGAIRETPVIADGECRAAAIMPVSLSFDHRAINGIAAAALLDSLAGLLAQPQQLADGTAVGQQGGRSG